MRTGLFIVACLMGEVMGGRATHAAINYLGSGRRVFASMTGGPLDQLIAPDNGPWMATAQSTAPTTTQATLRSSQTSSFTATGVIATGMLTYSRLSQDVTTGTASSDLTVFFTLDEATAYTLSGTADAISLINAGGTIHSGSMLSVSGILPAGMYQLDASASLTAPRPFPGAIGWSVSFAVPSSGGAATVGLGLVSGIGRRRRVPRLRA